MIALLLSLLVIAPVSAQDQRAPAPDGTIIGSVDVSGFDQARLSPGLRQDIRALTGTPLAQERLDRIVARIEEERPRHIAAVRSVLDADGKARVVFMIAARGESGDSQNVNTRYVVERAQIDGPSGHDIPPALEDAAQALAGRPLDDEEAERLQRRLEAEFPGYEVHRRIFRGSERGQIRVVFELLKKEGPRWLRFQPLHSNLVYDTAHEWGGFFDLGIGSGDLRFTPMLAVDDSDDLVEEYSGWGLRFETRRLGTRRLGASLEWSSFDPDWREKTAAAVAADPALPRLYDTRSTITPLVKFAITPDLTVSAGVGITELHPLSPATVSQSANAAIGALDFRRGWPASDDASQQLDARLDVRGGSRALESDYAYTRYLAQGAYRYDRHHQHAVASGMAGHISGTAPLFERFTLGDTRTLRGWDKYDIAPAGGSRMYYASVEYAYTGVGVFLDVGSVWDRPADRRARVSTGLTLRAGPTFATIGFPLNTDNVGAIFMMGIRVTETALRW
jgi:hypothetical protein